MKQGKMSSPQNHPERSSACAANIGAQWACVHTGPSRLTRGDNSSVSGYFLPFFFTAPFLDLTADSADFFRGLPGAASAAAVGSLAFFFCFFSTAAGFSDFSSPWPFSCSGAPPFTLDFTFLPEALPSPSLPFDFGWDGADPLALGSVLARFSGGAPSSSPDPPWPSSRFSSTHCSSPQTTSVGCRRSRLIFCGMSLENF
mmetsp:Transcript_68664/g.182927  ORF Transcript_68664/g.182927 Transcript_68664/m.182927 type:complete len:200 (-) Transcript_68664:1441-2040(-)